MQNQNTMEKEAPRRERRSFTKELKFNGWLFVATVTYLISLYLVQQNTDWVSWLKVVVTLTPVIPGLLYLRSGLKLIRAMDELQRRIQFEAWLFAAIGTVLVGTIINVLNANGIVWEKFPYGLEMGGTYLAMFFMWCVGIASANRRYQ